MVVLELLWLIERLQVGLGMLIEKLAAGVVRVQTPLGPRYVVPSFLQRIYLVWMFRHFPILPHAVLRSWQQRMVDRMCADQSFAAFAYSNGLDELPLIGTIEHRPAVGPQPLPPRRPVQSERSIAAEAQQQP